MHESFHKSNLSCLNFPSDYSLIEFLIATLTLRGTLRPRPEPLNNLRLKNRSGVVFVKMWSFSKILFTIIRGFRGPELGGKRTVC